MLRALLALFFPDPAGMEARDYATRDATTRALSSPLALPVLAAYVPRTPEGAWRRDRALAAAVPYEWRLVWRYLPLLAPGGREAMRGPGRDAWLVRFDEDALHPGAYSAWVYVHVIPPTDRQYDYDNVFDRAIPELLKRLGAK